MIETSSQPASETRQGGDRRPFLESSRAAAACSREFQRLGDEIRQRLESLVETEGLPKATVRQSPERLIVQLGPVALTLAWLQGHHDSVDMGELMAIVWRGSVAPVSSYRPEQPANAAAPRGATAIWEQVLSPVADSEILWQWHARTGPAADPCSSGGLAERCIDHLRAAYREMPSHD